MAPSLDWEKLMKVDPDVLPNQERLAEKMLKTLSQVCDLSLAGCLHSFIYRCCLRFKVDYT